MVTEDLEQSLRDEVSRHINERLSGLQSEITRLQAQLNDAFTMLAERAASDAAGNQELAAHISEHLHAAQKRGIMEAAASSARTRAASDVALIKAAVQDIDNQRSQSDILNALVNRAASFAPRTAFFIIKNNQAIGWRARGLEGTVGDAAIREFALPLSTHTLLSDAVESRQTWSGTGDTEPNNKQIYQQLGANEAPQRVVAVPLVARGRAVAVLYADSDHLGPDAVNLEALETLVRVAGMGVELLATQRPAPSETRIPAPQPFVPPAPHVAPPPTRSSTQQIAPEQVPAPTFALPSVDNSAAPTPNVSDYQAQAGTLPTSPPSNPAVSDSEAETPVEPPAAARPSPLGTARKYGNQAAELPIEVGSDEERRMHNDARRFARLLVSEIKLYNELKVREGREDGDLYGRLREEIDRSREMYDKRVAPTVSAKHDYFHHELVNTLAEGDEAKLGVAYPGATVPV